MKSVQSLVAAGAALLMLQPAPLSAANHREAPITAIDHKADITDVYAFKSYGGTTAGTHVTLIMSVDPLLEPGNGPTYFPFDKDILYEIKVDNNHDAVEDVKFQFRFTTEQRLPGVFTVYVGAGGGIPPLVPPQITTFDSPGLGQRQSYTVTMVKNGVSTPITNGGPLYAVPGNAGPRTMDYNALFTAGTYSLPGGVKTFAGTTDDAFWIDLGAAFDSLNLRKAVLTPAEDAAPVNTTPDFVSGYSVNSIAIEVPISMLTSTGSVLPANDPKATIGVWATTSRQRTTVRSAPLEATSSGSWSQVQRMGNALINELLIGVGSKNKFSMDQPKNDSQFTSFLLDPLLPKLLNAVFGVPIPAAPRLDLAPLVTYAPPIAAPGTPSGPIADMIRLNTGVAHTPIGSASRLGLLGGDAAGYPNGRRVFDDVTDISLRAVAGVLAGAPFNNNGVNNMLGDGVNVNDTAYRTSFPYLGNAPDGRNRRHIDPGEMGCTAGAGAPCLP